MLKLLSFVNHQPILHDESSEASQFCRDWLQGKEFFEVKTSGSTGQPKNIRLSRPQLVASALNTGNFLGYKKGDHMHICLDWSHIGGLMQFIRAMIFEMDIYIYSPHLKVVEDLMPIEGNNHVSLVTPMIAHALGNQKDIYTLQQFSTILVGGGFITETLEQQISQLKTNIFQTYGMTETASNLALRNITRQEKLYTLLSDWEIKIDNENCLAAFHPLITTEWIQTNDIVNLNNQQLEILGRRDFVINSGGKKYIPELLENELRKCKELASADFVISSIADEDFIESAVLVIDAKTKQVDLNLIHQILGKKIIQYIYTLDRIPRTGNGKFNRADVKKMIKEKQINNRNQVF